MITICKQLITWKVIILNKNNLQSYMISYKYSINGTLTGTTTLDQKRSRNNSNKRVTPYP